MLAVLIVIPNNTVLLICNILPYCPMVIAWYLSNQFNLKVFYFYLLVQFFKQLVD